MTHETTSLAPGLRTAAQFTIDAERTIDFLGEDLRIYATPKLVRDIEQLCQDFLLGFIAVGEHSVGTRIELDHLAATRMGVDVRLEAEVVGVDRRRVDFRFELIDNAGTAARGTHQRFVVNLDRLLNTIRNR